MKITKTLFTFFIVLILTFNARTENPCGIMYPQDTSSWGIGFIRLPENITIKCITTKTNTDCYISNGRVRYSNGNSKKIVWNDIVLISEYSYVFLKVFKVDDTKLMICSNTIEESIWVETDELNSNGLYLTTYISALNKNFNHFEDNMKKQILETSIGVNLMNSCLKLRTTPSTNGEIVTCLKNNLFDDPDGGPTSIEILEIIGNWAYIIAKDFKYDPLSDEAGEGCSYKVRKEYKGYIKLIDDNGRPSIWYAVR